MLIPLTITIAAGITILALLAAGVFFAQRALETAGRGGSPFGRWEFRPTVLGAALLLLVPLAGLLLWRVFPVMLLLPMVIPLAWRLRGSSIFKRRKRRQRGEAEDDDPIEGRYRPLDDQ